MRRSLVSLFVLAAVAAAPAAATAQDSLAPPGADPSWLPNEEWVNLRWMPVDEARLYAVLKTSRGEVFRWVRVDATNSLWMLASKKGLRDIDGTARKLIAPRAKAAGPRMTKVLVRRARRLLTQPHLAQHMLFHDLHQTAIGDNARRIFGVPSRQAFFDLRRSEVSPLQIGEFNGRSRSQLAQRAVEALRNANSDGVRGGAFSKGQADLMLARQLAQLPRWLGQNRYNGPTAAPSRPDVPKGDYANHPTVSAGGELVVWDAYRTTISEAEREGEIHVVSRNAAGERAGVSPPEPPGSRRPTSAYNSVVSGDGGSVVFESSETSFPLAKRVGNMTVIHRNLRTGALKKVSEIGRPAGIRTRTAFNPSISDDGRYVLFEANDILISGRPSGLAIWLADVQAGTQRRLLKEEPGLAYLPVISGDGSSIAFTEPSGGHTRIVVMSVASGSRAVVEAGGDVYEPALSADGSIVAFTTQAKTFGGDGGRSRVYVRELREGRTTLVSRGVGFAHQPSISGDGSQVAFVARREGTKPAITSQRSTLQIASVADPEPKPLFSGRGWSFQPAISRDGKTVVATTTAKVGSKPFGLAGVLLCRLDSGRHEIASTR
ncbi:MAG: hypothetical protein V9E83_03925 [Baekduia sp.]